MSMVRLRHALLSCAAPLSCVALVAFASPLAAQETPPVAEPAVQTPDEAAPDQTAPVEPAPDAAPTNPAPTPASPPPVIIPTRPLVTPIPAVWAPSPRNAAGNTAYGLYLSGRLLSSGVAGFEDAAGARGSAQLAEVARLTPEQPRVREQAFTAALIAGDLDDAARLAPTGQGVAPVIGEAGRLVVAVQTFAHGDARAAIAPLKGHPIRPPHGRAAVLVQPWIAAAAGEWDLALTSPPTSANDLFSLVIRFQRAQLLEIHRQYDEADVEYRALIAAPAAQAPFRMGYGAFLERRGRRDEAVAVYEALAATGLADAAVQTARDRAASGRNAPKLVTFREGAAAALTLASAVTASDSPEFAAVYLRLALSVLPSDKTRLLLGSTLAQAKLEAQGRSVLEQVSTADPDDYAAARVQIAASLARQDRDDDAVAEFQKAMAASPDDPRIAYFLAGQLVQMKRYDEALALLNGPLLNTADQSAEVRFMRGAAYESLNKVPEAEAELWAALQARPDEPAFLNYLGYLWVDSGTRVSEGAAMIARAHAADPDDGNIQDSLGWAQYRQGQYETAVATLEGAVGAEPANAEINDHLGDAYWQVGRRREAGFQWTRVLTLDPDDERRAAVETKIANGLEPQVPVVALMDDDAPQQGGEV